MTAQRGWRRGAGAALGWLVCALLLLAVVPANAQDRAQLLPTAEDGFGRVIVKFSQRLDLPAYKIRNENGVLAVEFEQAVDLSLPDVAVTLPDYVTIARIDPDRKGFRMGLRTSFTIHHMEAGGQLFIDLLPNSWQGLPPALPPAVVAELAARAKEAAELAEQRRKAALVEQLNPVATVRVGRNPTFMRIEFDWTQPTQGKFEQTPADEGPAVTLGDVRFDWPVEIDLHLLKSDLPPEIVGVENSVGEDGSHVVLKLAEGVEPRFYPMSDRRFFLDIDIAGQADATGLEDVAALLPQPAAAAPTDAESTTQAALEQSEITPSIANVGSTVRVTFPFDQDTAAAVFRRGDVVWLLFDTRIAIRQPTESSELSSIASGFSVAPAGETQVVRIDLSADRLATLGSEGRSWVLSLGDVLLAPTQPLPLHRLRHASGELAIQAEVGKPSRVHQFRDPEAGDVLQIVTAFPPARGLSRSLQFVDFAALPSVQGLVIRPEHSAVAVALDGDLAVISASGGLTLSPEKQSRTADMLPQPSERSTFLDLALAGQGIAEYGERQEELIGKAAQAEGVFRDKARLELAHFYLAHRFAAEALGVLDVLASDLSSDELRKPVRIALAVANVLAHRPAESMEILSSPGVVDEVDATMWRAIARTELADFAGARVDAMAAEAVLESYPRWVRETFLFAGARAALETSDPVLAQHFLGMLDFAKLDMEQVSLFQLLSARIAQAAGRVDEALDGYGQVIAGDVRPTRAEAVYRTLLLLDEVDRIDMAKATETLSAEVLLWRGDRLETMMRKLLAELYFRSRQYRPGFEAVREAVAYGAENASTTELLGKAQAVFADLYLNGGADQLADIDALGLYYDFRELTPAGARGDEMIRNLARRLVKVDLLEQAALLLQYQVDNRLKGAARAQVAAELAIVRLASRDPEAALRVLHRTRMADLPPSLERQRRILEARALIDADRQDLALDLLRNLTGRDAELLRIDGLWKNKQYQTAAELLEVVYSADQSAELPSSVARTHVVKAAIGFVLAGDQLGLSRLRSKFGERMAQTPEWPLFDFVTSNVSSESAEFRKMTRELSGLDSLEAFLDAYRDRYATPEAAIPNRVVASNVSG